MQEVKFYEVQVLGIEGWNDYWSKNFETLELAKQFVKKEWAGNIFWIKEVIMTLDGEVSYSIKTIEKYRKDCQGNMEIIPLEE